MTVNAGLLGIGLGLSTAPNQMVESYRAGKKDVIAEDTAKLARTEARMKQQRMQAELDKLGVPSEKESLQIQQLRMQVDDMSSKQTRRDTHNALTKVLQTSDFKHLQGFLDDNERARKLLNAQTVQRLNLTDGAEDRDWLNNMIPDFNKIKFEQVSGMGREAFNKADAEDGSTDGMIKMDPKAFSDRFVKVQNLDGKWELRDMTDVYALSGWSLQATKEELALLKERQGLGKGKDDKPEVDMAVIREKVRKGEKLTPEEDVANLEWESKTLGKDVAKAEVINRTARTLETWKPTGNREDEPTAVREALDKIETVRPWGKTSDGKKLLSESVGLVALARKASEMTDESSGLVDKQLNKFSDYAGVSGDKARIAYRQWLGQYRHKLFGGTLTGNELSEAKQIFGEESMQVPALLTRMRVALAATKAEYDLVKEQEDKFVFKRHAGKAYADLEKAINGLDRAIAMSVGVYEPAPAARDNTSDQPAEVIGNRPKTADALPTMERQSESRAAELSKRFNFGKPGVRK